MNQHFTYSNPLPHGIAKLAHLGIIRATGEDAAKFLQGQLTNDFVLLGVNESRLAAYCSPKGRMLASFIGFKRAPDDILLICSQDILAQTLKRLSMYMMRAKLKLSDASADFDVYGLLGNAIKSIATNPINTPATGVFNTSILLALRPALGQARALLITPAGSAAPVGDALPQQAWALGEVHAGIATITAPIVEAFVPQMLNYESVGGVNFKKGCYPGQEVVARSQFRGTLKRRTYLVHMADTNAQAFVGQDVFHDSDPEQACGTVAQVAQNPDGSYSALVSMQITAAETGKLTLGSTSGAHLTLLPLPYDLLADI